MSRTWRPPTDGTPPPEEALCTRRRTAYAIAVLGLDVVDRYTVRQLVVHLDPAKRAANPRHNPGDRFKKALQSFEGWGWVLREGPLIRVLDRQALYDHATDDRFRVPAEMLRLRATADELARRALHDRLTHADLERARAELVAVCRLMTRPPGRASRVLHRAGRDNHLERTRPA